MLERLLPLFAGKDVEISIPRRLPSFVLFKAAVTFVLKNRRPLRAEARGRATQTLFRLQWHCARSTRAYCRYLHSCRESYPHGPHQVELPSSQEGKNFVQPRCVSPSVGIRRANCITIAPGYLHCPVEIRALARPANLSRLQPSASTCLLLRSLCSVRTPISQSALPSWLTRDPHVRSHGRTPPVEWPFRDSRSRCAASSQQACRGCPHSILGSSTKLAK